MQLKTIKLSGFKSFAEKTKIELQPGATIIVGPNGSGKSNITEAVRWVLGEQSAKTLRGQKMGDVIFSGAQQKAAMNLAQVSLLFDNSDHYLDVPYSELEVTRKLFRNGESWYGINGQECRLKDITSLFMDSGIGADGFSIISQGNVEEVFNSTAESRRSIVETVAGIFQYKQQKKTAETKIVKVEDNLSRVNDISFELSARLPALAKQKDVALDYLDQKKKLNELKEQRELSNWRKVTADVLELENQIQNLQETKEKFNQSLTDSQQQLVAAKLTVTNQQQLITEQTDKLQQLTQAENELHSAVKLTQQENRFQQQTKLDLEQRLTSTNQQLQELTAKLKDIRYQLTDNQQQQHDYQQRSQNVSEKLNDLESNGSHKLAQLQVQYVELIQKQSSATEQRVKHQQASEQREQKLKELNQQNKDLKLEQTNLIEQRQQLTDRLAILRKQQEQLQQQQAEQSKIQQQLTQQYSQLQTSWLSQLRKLETIKGQLEYQQQNEYQPFYQGVANVMNQQAQFSGVFGLVADFIKTDNRYTIAIETALGGRLQNILVDTDQTAKEIVEWLTNSKSGRVTFLPVSEIKAVTHRKITSDIREVPGFLGSAEELVDFPSEFKDIKAYLFANILISSDLTAAIRISKLGHQRFKVVSLDGQVVNLGGSITGGKSARGKTQLLTTKSKVQRLRQEVERYTKSITEEEADVKNVQQQLEAIKQTIVEKHRIELQVQQELKTVEQQLILNQEATDKIISLLTQNNEQQAQYEQMPQVTDQLDPKQLQMEITNVQQQLIAQEQQNEQTAKRKTELSEKLATIQQTTNQLQAQAKYLTANEQETQESLAKSQEDQLQIQQQIKKLQADLEITNETEIQQKLQTILTKKQTTTGLQQQLTNEQEQLSLRVENLSEQVNQLKVELTKLDSRLTLLLDKYESKQKLKQDSQQILVERFNYQLSDLKKVSQAQDNNVDNQIKLLEKGLEELGPVNVNAIEEYQQVAERNQFLTDQKADLTNSIQELKDTIAIMDQESTNRFLNTFDQLAQSFEKVFQQLFGGGKAKLELTDPKHPLTTGIEIMAMPPGKKYRALSLLSGGERTLTAIALLFAILAIKPVPFVILDEAEAALDPVNVDRFARYIQQFASKTQFIVVTHRKETMVYGDQLYGVTMQESGVSKVVSVALQTDDEVRK